MYHDNLKALLVLMTAAISISYHISQLEALAPIIISDSNTDSLSMISPEMQCLNLESFPTGAEIQGFGIVKNGLTIRMTDNPSGIIKVVRKGATGVYGAPNSGNISESGCLKNGFHDVAKKHNYEFSFDSRRVISEFSLQILDYGDYNAVGATRHTVALVGYDKNGNELVRDEFKHESNSAINPSSLFYKGDACSAKPANGDPGNLTLRISSNANISKVYLVFSHNGRLPRNRPSDPNIAVGEVCFRLKPVS